VIGVVGAIGAGKSAAARAMAARGGAAVDADRLGHDALERPDVKAAAVARWGTGVLKPDGTADRRAIAAVVFADPAERRALEALVYPVIQERVADAVAAAQADPAVRFVVLDAAVMLEAGWHDRCDRILYVDAPPAVRLARVAARSGWTAADLAAREAAQMPAAEKRRRADAVIENAGTPADLQAAVDRVLAGWGLLPAAAV
jgi:dephospho-CoA kinase